MVGPLSALVDTGADVCIVPSAYLVRLKVLADDERYLRPLGGVRRRVRIYTIDIGIGSMRLPSVEVVGDEIEAEVILGRNVLNKLLIVLDGPNQIADVAGV